MPAYVKALPLRELSPGSAKAVELNGKMIALFNVAGQVHASDNACLHRGGPLGEGALEGGTVTCPWHGWKFDAASGACQMNPKMKVRTYPVKIEGPDIFVDVE